jgi:predicted RNA-binding protein associated with RNAse of E/G family
MITEPGRYYSVYLIWDHTTDRFICYYVNFQLPLIRSFCGFDTYDLELDIVVEPNRNWRLKDEAAFEEGIRMGVIKRMWAEAVAREKELVVAAIEDGRYPFNDYWKNYAVDPLWTPPSLPPGWDVAEENPAPIDG